MQKREKINTPLLNKKKLAFVNAASIRYVEERQKDTRTIAVATSGVFSFSFRLSNDMIGLQEDVRPFKGSVTI